MRLRLVLALLAALPLAACISAEQSSLAPEAVARFRLADVVVDFAPDAAVHFSDAEDDVTAGKAHAPGEVRDADGHPRPEDIKAYERQRAAAVLRAAFLRELGPRLTGGQPVIAHVTVANFWVPGVLGTLVVGGSASVRAGVDLIDAKSKTIIIGFTPDQGSGAAMAAGGVIGVAVNAAVDSSSEDGRAGRLATNFAHEYTAWLFGKSGG